MLKEFLMTFSLHTNLIFVFCFLLSVLRKSSCLQLKDCMYLRGEKSGTVFINLPTEVVLVWDHVLSVHVMLF